MTSHRGSSGFGHGQGLSLGAYTKVSFEPAREQRNDTRKRTLENSLVADEDGQAALVPLSRQALALLDGLRSVTVCGRLPATGVDRRYLFRSLRSAERPISEGIQMLSGGSSRTISAMKVVLRIRGRSVCSVIRHHDTQFFTRCTRRQGDQSLTRRHSLREFASALYETTRPTWWVFCLLFSCSACTNQSYPVVGDVNYDYPLPGSPDIQSMRRCPLSWMIGQEMQGSCGLLGLKGPVKKISWNDPFLKVEGGYVLFDRGGRIIKQCGLTHGPRISGGWICGEPPFSGFAVPDKQETRLDSKGRLVSKLKYTFDKSQRDTCSYDDASDPKTSECNDGEYIHKYTYDPRGRPHSYSRRRISRPEDAPERKNELDRAYALDVTYVYKDDAHGNWTEFYLIQDMSTSRKPIGADGSLQKRTIEYY
jgi:hypothetical protein